jgi:glutaminyl-tRNA synthetase
MSNNLDKSAENNPTAEAGAEEATSPQDFIRDIVAEDLKTGRHEKIITRFPPEPNGYLHIGHAKAILLSFGIARDFKGVFNLRMDDTNPTKEESEYVEAIHRDVNWLIGGEADQVISDRSYFSSDYFEQLYDYAVELIKQGKAFVCDQTPEEFMDFRGSPTVAGRPSPWRDRPVGVNLDLFERMKNGEFPDGSKTLRAKIDMASPNIHMRDPALYRVRHAHHHRSGDLWCIYPMYDYAHCLSDSIEGITHSVCTLEFEVHRPLYDWILAQLPVPEPRPHQYEFARLSIGYTVLSKRKLLQLVKDGDVDGWDDPRMPTISGLRRRGVPASAIRTFCQTIGVTKFNSLTDVAVLEYAIRIDLNKKAPRRFGVLRPLKVVITNYPEDKVEDLDAVNNPEDPDAGKRNIPFSRELYIEQDDFMEDPPKKFFRLRPGGEVRLKYAFIIHCDEVVKNDDGTIKELHCTADLDSRMGGPNAGRKIKGTIHWVSAAQSVAAQVKLYDRLFTVETPDAGGEDGDFKKFLNPHSLETVEARLEPGLAEAEPGTVYQFERMGYFCLDGAGQGGAGAPLVFNRTITLRDTWAKLAKKS